MHEFACSMAVRGFGFLSSRVMALCKTLQTIFNIVLFFHDSKLSKPNIGKWKYSYDFHEFIIVMLILHQIVDNMKTTVYF